MTCNNIINKVKGLVKGIFALYLLAFLPGSVSAQNKIVNPDISYAGTPRQCEIGGITVKGVEDYEDMMIINLSGLHVGQRIEVPGNEITEAVKRYWKHGLFSEVSITADSIIDSQVYLCIHLATRPRISNIEYHGVKKSERTDLEAKLGMTRGMSLTKNIIDRIEVVPINDTEMKLQIRLMTGASDSMTYTKKGGKSTRRSGNISKKMIDSYKAGNNK